MKYIRINLNIKNCGAIYSHFFSHGKLTKLCKYIYSLQLCVGYIYKLKLYLTNTTLIYEYNLHIIVENKKNYIIIKLGKTNKMTTFRLDIVKGLIR